MRSVRVVVSASVVVALLFATPMPAAAEEDPCETPGDDPVCAALAQIDVALNLLGEQLHALCLAHVDRTVFQVDCMLDLVFHELRERLPIFINCVRYSQGMVLPCRDLLMGLACGGFEPALNPNLVPSAFTRYGRYGVSFAGVGQEFYFGNGLVMPSGPVGTGYYYLVMDGGGGC